MSNLRYIYALGILPFHLSYALDNLIDRTNFWFFPIVGVEDQQRPTSNADMDEFVLASADQILTLKILQH